MDKHGIALIVILIIFVIIIIKAYINMSKDCDDSVSSEVDISGTYVRGHMRNGQWIDGYNKM